MSTRAINGSTMPAIVDKEHEKKKGHKPCDMYTVENLEQVGRRTPRRIAPTEYYHQQLKAPKSGQIGPAAITMNKVTPTSRRMNEWKATVSLKIYLVRQLS